MSLELAAAIADRDLPKIDAIGDFLQPLVRSAIEAGGQGLSNFLDGVWLSSPLHPAVTDIPIGAATAAGALDVLGLATRRRHLERQADGALAVAVAGGLGAAVTGLAEARWLRGGHRRVALVHALVNVAGIGLNVASLAARAAGRRPAGRALSLSGLVVTTIAAHLGGELSFGLGVRVNPNDPTRSTSDAVGSFAAEEVADGRLVGVDVGRDRVVVARCSGDELCAIAATCSHLHGPLDRGERRGDTVICPWHHSRFDLRTGAVINGPAVFPQPRYVAVERDGRVEVRHSSAPAPAVVHVVSSLDD